MIKDNNLSESLRYIYEQRGIDTFLNEKIVYAILVDLMPKNSREINWVIDAINSGAIKPLIEAEKNNLNKDESKQKSRKIFDDNEINKSRTTYLLESFYYGFKWTDKIISLKEIKDRERKVDIKKVNDKNVNSNINTKKNEHIIIKEKNESKSDYSKKTASKKNVDSKNKQHKQQKQPQVTQAQLNKLEFEYNTLSSEINKIIQYNNSYMMNLKSSNMIFNGILNVVVFLICMGMMISYVVLFKEGYTFNKVLILDIVGMILGIKIIRSNYYNLKKLKNDFSMKKIYEKYINLRNSINFNQTLIKNNEIKTPQKYYEFTNRLKLYRDEYTNINNEGKKLSNNIGNKKSKIAISLLLFCIIFMLSGVYEPRLLYDRDGVVNIISRNIVERIYGQVYESGRACVKTDYANIRRKADINSEQVTVLKKYEVVYLTGKSYEKDGDIWYEAKTSNGKGWINSSVILIVPNSLTVIEQAANVRTAANLNSDVATVVNYGDIVYTTGVAIDTGERIWYEIYSNGNSGYWISSKVVEAK